MTDSKPLIYVCFGNTLALDPSKRDIETRLMAALNVYSGDGLEFIQGFPTNDTKGKLRWEPSIPCDGLIIIPLFSFAGVWKFDVSTAESSFSRERRSIPVLECGFINGADGCRIEVSGNQHVRTFHDLQHNLFILDSPSRIIEKEIERCVESLSVRAREFFHQPVLA